MSLFGKSFEEKVQAALATIRGKFPQAMLDADVAGEDVTLRGVVPNMALKNAVMQAFNELVETHQTFNTIRVETAPAAAHVPQVPSAGSLTDVTRPVIIDPAPAPPEPTERIHEVVKGDTLSAIAKKYLGNANLYMKIFEANRDTLKDPNVIQPGQRLRIPN